MVLRYILGRGRRAGLAIWILGRGTSPLVGARKTVGLLLVGRVLHVCSGLLGRRRRERRVHLVDVKRQRAVRQLTRGGDDA